MSFLILGGWEFSLLSTALILIWYSTSYAFELYYYALNLPFIKTNHILYINMSELQEVRKAKKLPHVTVFVLFYPTLLFYLIQLEEIVTYQ